MATFPLQKHPVDEMYGEAKVSVPSTLEIMVTVIIYLTGGRFSGERIIHCERERERDDNFNARIHHEGGQGESCKSREPRGRWNKFGQL